ncbi:enterotoxin [Anopheles sinensis]|uniref:Enterotoxin n=1 Tax=Anopheles sinensis TaxID=74873 RepID=A0A084WPX3_ANOSI|nr:enterotoxin [Anopheles sinensis]
MDRALEPVGIDQQPATDERKASRRAKVHSCRNTLEQICPQRFLQALPCPGSYICFLATAPASSEAGKPQDALGGSPCRSEGSSFPYGWLKSTPRDLFSTKRDAPTQPGSDQFEPNRNSTQRPKPGPFS